MKNKSFAFKLFTCTSILVVTIIFCAIFTILMLNKLQEYASQTANNWLPSIDNINKGSIIFSNYSRREMRVVMYPEIRTENINALLKYREEINKWSNEYEKRFLRDVNEIEVFKKLQNGLDGFFKVSDEIIALSKQGNTVQALNTVQNKGLPLLREVEESLKKLAAYNFDGGVASTTKGRSLRFLTISIMTGILIASILISVLIVYIIRASTKPISIGAQDLKKQSKDTSNIAGELKKGAQSLQDSVSDQAASLHETSAAINEITSMINRTTENARESSNLSKEVNSIIEEGQMNMKNMVEAMETIQEASSQLKSISDVIGQIEKKTIVINEIVSKTELLSLNASIESARAGEHGKGFAVVAEEVGNLAKISGKSAQEIQDLIKQSQVEVEKVIMTTSDRVSRGKDTTNAANESFQKISSNIGTMTQGIQQISEAAQEQEIGVRQIAQAVVQIDSATQKIQQTVSSTSGIAVQLVGQSEKLSNVAVIIDELVNGKS